MTPDLPGGTVTFLFTDIEGSTPLWESEPDLMRRALAQHDAILRQAVAAQNGHLYKSIGDAIQAAFALPAEALAAALAAQRALETAAWPTSGPLRVRMGLHVGPAEPAGADYATTHTLNRAARMMAAAHGGQIVLSAALAELLHGHLPPGASLLDLGQHRMKGLNQREHLFQLAAPDLPAAFPPLATLEAMPNNLPIQLTSFVGREQDLAEIEGLLMATRLLTLAGSGGTGKTRLSLKVAERILPGFPDGVWWVELAPVADPALVAHAVAGSLGLRQQPDRSMFETLADYLRAKQLLLILDNCEHVLAACASLADGLLRQSPRLRILASSREALGIAGETTYPVPSLSLPPAAGAMDLSQLAQSEAVQLFVERAQAALPSFSLTNDNAAAIALICRRLDGIPLAIELAAARVRLLRADQIAARLDDRFRLLTGGSRTALPRQQTLRALIDWSYDLLSDQERQFLQVLSVFAGGWTLEAAEAVYGEGTVGGAASFDLLSQLVDKSLVVVEPSAGSEPRYRLLETVRQYAREKLVDAERWRGQHLRYFRQYAEQNAAELTGPRLLAWLDRFELEHDNFRAALAWGVDSDPLAALQLARALGYFWARRGYEGEGVGWLEAALARAAAAAPAEAAAARPYQLARARALAIRAFLDFGTMHNIPAMQGAAEESVQLARQLGDDGILDYSLGVLGLAALFWGDITSAQASAEAGLALARPRNDDLAAIMALGALTGVRFNAEHRLDEARALFVEALRLSRQMGDPWAIAQHIRGLGRFALEYGNLVEGRAQIEESIEGFRLLGDFSQENHARSDLAQVLRRQGQIDQATVVYQETLRAWQHMGHRGAIAQQLESLASIAIDLEHAVRAARLLGAAESLRELSGAVRMTYQQVEYDQALVKLRGQMPPAGLEAAWAAGKSLSLDQAVETGAE